MSWPLRPGALPDRSPGSDRPSVTDRTVAGRTVADRTTDPSSDQSTRRASGVRELRRRQAIGLLWLALAVFAFSAIRSGWHAVFLPRWWHIW